MKNKALGPESAAALSWANSLMQTKEHSVQQLGNGLLYCSIINRLYPQYLPLQKIARAPKNIRDYRNNLRLLTEALRQLKWLNVTFDITKASSMSYQQNCQLLVKIHKAATSSTYPSTYTGIHNLPTSFENKTESHMGGLSHSIYIGLATPLKMHPKNDERPSIVEKIKEIVKQSKSTDREKVCFLKKLLDMQIQDRKKIEPEGDGLLEDDRKNETIVIDES